MAAIYGMENECPSGRGSICAICITLFMILIEFAAVDIVVSEKTL